MESTLKSLKSEIDDNLAKKSAVSSVAKISAMNTKTVQEVKAKFGGFDLADFNKRIEALSHGLKQGSEDMKHYIRENFSDDLKKTKFEVGQLSEDLEERFKTVKVDEINQSLAAANSKRDEIFVLLEEVKKSQSEVVQKMQGVGSNNDKLESTLGKKIGSVEDEMYKLQGEYVKLQELAGHAENFNIWHETVGKELESTSDSLIKNEQELLETFTKMQSEMTVLKPIGMDLEAMREQNKKIFTQQSEYIRKISTELAVAKQSMQIQDNEIGNLKEAMAALEKQVGVEGTSFVDQAEESSIEQPVVEEVVVEEVVVKEAVEVNAEEPAKDEL